MCIEWCFGSECVTGALSNHSFNCSNCSLAKTLPAYVENLLSIYLCRGMGGAPSLSPIWSWCGGMGGAPSLSAIGGWCGGTSGAPSLSPNVALRGGRAGAGVSSEVRSSTSGLSSIGRTPVIKQSSFFLPRQKGPSINNECNSYPFFA